MRRFALCLLSLFTVLPLVAAAQQKSPQTPCSDAVTQYEVNQCAHKEYLAADAELNKVYKQLSGKLDEEERALLKNAETAWLKYRDANCEYESAFYRGGTLRPAIYSFCLARMTSERTAELKQQIESLEMLFGEQP
jgi:uncharacterized protein YecT (DUF1311 family)